MRSKMYLSPNDSVNLDLYDTSGFIFKVANANGAMDTVTASPDGGLFVNMRLLLINPDLVRVLRRGLECLADEAAQAAQSYHPSWIKSGGVS